jgi:hypothetical protein
MSSKTAFEALATAFSNGWKKVKDAGPPIVYEAKTSIAWPNVAFTPPSTSWVRFSVIDGGSEWRSCGSPGSNRAVHAGLVVIQIFVPLLSGESSARGLADDAAAVFRGKVISGIRFAPAYMHLVPNSLADAWHQINVSIPFQRDEFI